MNPFRHYNISIKFTYRKDYLKFLNKIAGDIHSAGFKLNYGKNIIGFEKLLRSTKYPDLLRKLKIKNTLVKIRTYKTIVTEELIQL